MRKLLILFCTMLFTSCSNRPFVGYVVGKQYTPPHTKIRWVLGSTHYERSFIVFVANTEGVITVHTNNFIFDRVKCGDKVRVTKMICKWK